MKLSDIFYSDDLWICDPKKCPNCSKTCCHDGFCYHTSDKNQRARGIKRFKFFLEFLIFGTPSWKLRYKWKKRREKKAKDVNERQKFEQFAGHRLLDAQWELLKKVSDIVKKCPPDCEVKWRRVNKRRGIMYYRPEYVKKGEKDAK